MTTPKAKVHSVKATKDVVSEVAKNFLMGVPAIRRSRSKMGRTSPPSDAALLDRYAFPLLNRAVNWMDISGADVFEIGPGDHLSSGLALLAAGARSYTCADRFAGNYSSPAAKTWYRTVRSMWPESYPAWPETLDAETFPECCAAVRILPLGVENLFDVGTFALVGSTSVGEHVSGITAFAEASQRLLRPGGIAIHHIDFAPHDYWRTDYGPAAGAKREETATIRSGADCRP